jgi:hypothetical protein
MVSSSPENGFVAAASGFAALCQVDVAAATRGVVAKSGWDRSFPEMLDGVAGASHVLPIASLPRS